MKGRFLLSSALISALLTSSCTSDIALEQDLLETGNSVSFTLRTPVGEKVGYTRTLHDASEYAINSLQLYEYEVTESEDGEKATSLTRILKYPAGTGRDVLEPIDNGNGSYTFSIIIPASYEGKTYTYRLVANNATTNVMIGESADNFRDKWYSAVILKNSIVETETGDGDSEGGEEGDTPAASETKIISPAGDALANPEKGIAMTGSAVASGTQNDEIKIGVTTRCDVELTRIVSRVDIRHEIPNLKLTKVELNGAPVKTFLFPRMDDNENTLFADAERLKVDLNSTLTLPEYYLKDNENENIVDLKKAFYLYERANSEEDSAWVHIEYKVDANGTEYDGSIDVPFRHTSDEREYINTERNHLYTIVLGNSDDPVAGKVSATLIVDDWNLIEIDEPLTD